MRPLHEMPLPMVHGEERVTIDGTIRERGDIGDSKLTIEVPLTVFRIMQQDSKQFGEAKRVLRSIVS